MHLAEHRDYVTSSQVSRVAGSHLQPRNVLFSDLYRPQQARHHVPIQRVQIPLPIQPAKPRPTVLHQPFHPSPVLPFHHARDFG